ncbi:hypothetical protein EPI10_024704 [Gossypium australe]|uniref:Uncharacterized protein n=1 Tax=Gossypium australe TaxID=47621 RepID=A0A5B6VYB8_9ROSI|nr:hypothetical protein EPI10_024704 [Gossypium australe]
MPQLSMTSSRVTLHQNLITAIIYKYSSLTFGGPMHLLLPFCTHQIYQESPSYGSWHIPPLNPVHLPVIIISTVGHQYTARFNLEPFSLTHTSYSLPTSVTSQDSGGAMYQESQRLGYMMTSGLTSPCSCPSCKCNSIGLVSAEHQAALPLFLEK